MSPTALETLSLSSDVRLASCHRMPLLGFRCTERIPPSETEIAVSEALKAGYRQIDSAAAYNNEAACANAIRASGIERDQILFTSKVHPSNISYDGARATIDESLRLTQFNYIDLFLLHCPTGEREDRFGAWQALVEAQEKGKVKAIGVSNFGIHHLEELETLIQRTEETEGKGKGGVIDVAQYDLHPWCSRKEIVNWCKSRNIVLQAFCPIVRGGRFDEPSVQALTKKYGKTPAQLLLRWSLQMCLSPLPKSVTPSRIVENTQLYDFELSSEEMEALTTDDYSPCAWDPTVWRVK